MTERLLDLLRQTCCGGAPDGGLDEARSTELAQVFRALGDPVRLRLVSLIAQRDETCVCDLTSAFTLSGSTISHHLRILREAGLVGCERRGTWVHYWIEPGVLDRLGDLLDSVVPAGRR